MRISKSLERFSYESRTDATGTYLDSSDAAVVFNRFYFLEIRVPDCTGFIVCVADIVSEAGAFTTNFAFS